MSTNSKWLTTFLKTYFTRLPDDILLQIFNLVTYDRLFSFMHFPDAHIHDLLIRNYYSVQIYFVIHPIMTSLLRSYLPNRKDCFYGKDAIFQFMDEFSDIIPHRIILENAIEDFNYVREILDMYHNRIDKVRELVIMLEKSEITIEEFDYILSFPNLTKLYFSKMDLRKVLPGLINNLKLIHHPNLQEIVLLDHDITDWKGLKLPKKLKHLDCSFNLISYWTLEIPPHVSRFICNDANIFNFGIFTNKLPESLSELQLSGNELEMIVIDDLPRALRILDLSWNNITTISGKKWPVNLTELLLNNNSLDDNALELVNIIGWPKELTYLDICDNQIKSIENFSKLPSSLTSLNVSTNPFIWKDKFVFPSGLSSLCMFQCGVQDLQSFQFPKSLERLILAKNEIKDMMAIDWNEFINLRVLDLSENLITSLQGWNKPPNLVKFHFEGNPLLKDLIYKKK